MSSAVGRPATNAAFFANYDPAKMGRKHVQEKPTYSSTDFLKDPTIDSRPAERGLGVSDLKSSKFGAGFSRRPQSQIKQDEDRKVIEAKLEQRQELALQHKREVRAAINGNHGNVMVGGEAITEPIRPEGLRILKDKGPWVLAEEKQRAKASSARFFEPPQPKAANRTDVPRVVKTTSDIGYGRADLPSNGVADNFMGHGYK